MSTEHIHIRKFSGHPVFAATSPTLDDLLELLAHPQAYDPEGDEGEPALVIKGCFRPDGRFIMWVADQCTHSQMSDHLLGNRTVDLRAFHMLVLPSYGVVHEERDFDIRDTPDLERLIASLDRATLRSRLGRFEKRASPRDCGIGAYR